MRLSELKPGQQATITNIHATSPTRRRLMEMGLIKGSKITIICRAPFNDPIELEIRDYKLTLRKKEADTITVEANPS